MTIFNDKTRREILPHLEKTKDLICKTLEEINGEKGFCEIIPLEDLCIPNNVVRMQGGFYTGCLVKWESKIPFVPVDATVNACGVSVFKLSKMLTENEFLSGVNRAREVFGDSWNFDNGNHFVSLCKGENGDAYLVVHASDNTYKYGEKGLYPYNNPWYESEIQVYKQENRYLRYIKGQSASDFYELYKLAEKSNPLRNRKLCEIIAGESLIQSEIYTPHYGMPNQNSVAIGCQWGRKQLVLLTAPSKDIFVFEGDKNLLYPHGFGMKLGNITSGIKYENGELFINGESVKNKSSFIKSGGLENRYQNKNINREFLKQFFSEKTYLISAVLKQICAITRDGFEIYN